MFLPPNGALVLCCHRSLLHCVIANALIILGRRGREEWGRGRGGGQEMYSSAQAPCIDADVAIVCVRVAFGAFGRETQSHAAGTESDLARHWLSTGTEGALNH